MLRMPVRRLACAFASLALAGPTAGCSDGTSTTVDTKSVIEKVSGGDGQRQSAKAKAASEDAAKSHPKLH